MERITSTYIVIFGILQMFSKTNGLKNLIYAVNAGGDAMIDAYGVKYEKDPLQTVGVSSDHGMRLSVVGRVNEQDAMLYRTERYSDNTFGYLLPLKGDGDYTLVLKFCEVYFRHNRAKVFDVVLNEGHFVVPDLDIHARVGFGVAHDEIIPFKVTNNGKKLIVGDSESAIKNNKVSLKFVKGSQDNPKINAFYLIKGTTKDVPMLPEIVNEEDQLFEEDEENEAYATVNEGLDTEVFHFNGRQKLRKQPVHPDPWDNESLLTVFTPVLWALGLSSIATVCVLRVAKSY